nr:hypothetical protein [Streptomyces sp. DHE17-7]
MRSPSVSRLYLQVPADTDAESWSDEEILGTDHGRPYPKTDDDWQ